MIAGDDGVGCCERCESVVERRELEQWFFRITNYAEELLNFNGIDWPDRIRRMQTNWIGRSEGASIVFPLEHPVEDQESLSVFTTRPDTVFGVTSMVLAPEHPLVPHLTTDAKRDAVETYQRETRLITEIERQSTEREKHGVFTGSYALHPFTGVRIPIWIADYVLLSYGTGAVMGVPAHDTRDFAFAQKYTFDIPVVIAPPEWDGNPLTEAHVEDGILVNSGEFDGLDAEEGKRRIASSLQERGLGGPTVTYRIRDWLVSRQRYWGEPFPILHGPFGEDGTVQGLLELANIPYVGAPVLASALGMDKAIMKVLFATRRLPVVKHVIIWRSDWKVDRARAMTAVTKQLSFPMFVKPTNLGSSIGITKAKTSSELEGAVDYATEFDRKIIVEEAVPNAREIECAVLGNDRPETSVPGEILPTQEFYNYQAKYLDTDSRLLIPAPLTEKQTKKIRRLALETFRTIEGAGMARVDFLMTRNSGRIYVNEVNTIPGFTTISMYAKLWEASGVRYPILLDRLIDLALERHAEKQQLRTSLS